MAAVAVGGGAGGGGAEREVPTRETMSPPELPARAPTGAGGGRGARGGDVARRHPLVLARLGFTLALAVYGAVALRHPERYRFLDGVDLLIHEAGHVVFAPFGEFVSFLGGTLFQLLIPLAFLASFLRRGQPYAAAVMLWWVAQNLGNISVYIRDARTQLLPLVGGGVHDWGYLLGRLGLLAHDGAIADAVRLAGVAVWLAAVALGIHFAQGDGAAAPRAGRRR